MLTRNKQYEIINQQQNNRRENMGYAEKSGILEATLEILKIKMETEIKYSNQDMTQVLQDYVKYIDQQLKKVGE